MSRADLRGFDAVIHLAALSNDPLGCLNEQCTYDINHLGSVRLAQAAKAAGVPRFLFASSCSLYGAAGDQTAGRDRRPSIRSPPTAHRRCWSKRTSSKLADDTFSPTYLRNATAYGVSPRLRADIVVNNLVGVAYTTGQVVIQSDGTPWRPLVHIEDISRAFLAVLEAPREAVHNQAFNVGSIDGELPDSRCCRDRAGGRAWMRQSSISKAAGRIRAAIASIATSWRGPSRDSGPNGTFAAARPSCTRASYGTA